MIMAKELSSKVFELLNDPQAVKILASKSSDHKLHTVPLGSLSAPDHKTIILGKILIKETHANLEKAVGGADLVSVLVVKGGEAYQIRCKVKEFATKGPIFDAMAAAMKAKNMPLSGVWILEPEEVVNQSPGPEAGKTI
jgi:hypothetical protein